MEILLPMEMSELVQIHQPKNSMSMAQSASDDEPDLGKYSCQISMGLHDGKP